MSHATALMGMNLGEARRREARAKERGKRFEVDPEVRAARARMLEERQVLHDQAEAAAKAAQKAAPSALKAVLSRGTVDELAEISRSISRFDGRRLQAIVDELFRAKSRNGYQPDDEASQEATRAVPTVKASRSHAGPAERRQ